VGLSSVQYTGVVPNDGRGDVADIITGISVFGWLLAACRGEQRIHEAVDLRTRIVEIVFSGDFRTLCSKHSAQRVPDGRPTCRPEMDRTGRVGRDELQVDRDTVELVGTAVLLACRQHTAHLLRLCSCGKPQVHETGS